MKIRVNEVPVSSCFMDKNGKVKKKVSDDRCAAIGRSGRVSMRKVKGDSEVEPISSCPLNLLAVGLRRHPDAVVEIGDGNLLKRKGKR